MPNQCDVLITGGYFCDMIFTGLNQMPCIGTDVFCNEFDMVPGGCYYSALALHRLGLNTAWLCDIGNDIFSKYILDQAKQQNLNVSNFRHYDEPRRFIASSLSFQEDRSIVSFCDKPYRMPSEKEIINLQPRLVLLPGVDCCLHINDYQTAKKQFGSIIVMDCQHTQLTMSDDGVVDALKCVDVFIPNEKEATEFTGETDVFRALDRLSEIIPAVIIKRGSKGAIARQGNELIEVPAIKVEVKDTTGAGDNFNAGAIYAILNNLELELVLRFGNIVGGLSVTTTGAPSLRSVDEITIVAKGYPSYC